MIMIKFQSPDKYNKWYPGIYDHSETNEHWTSKEEKIWYLVQKVRSGMDAWFIFVVQGGFYKILLVW